MARIHIVVCCLAIIGCGNDSGLPRDSNSKDTSAFRKIPGTRDEYLGHAGKISIVENENNGIAKDLTARLAKLMTTRPDVQAAYLVRVKYDGKERGVACAIEASDAEMDQQLRREVFDIFAELKGTRSISLDCFKVTSDIEAELKAKAKPFYIKGKI